MGSKSQFRKFVDSKAQWQVVKKDKKAKKNKEDKK